MSRKHKKPHPSMPTWWWNSTEPCCFCKNMNNCSQCKTARKDAKSDKRMRKSKGRKSVMNDKN